MQLVFYLNVSRITGTLHPFMIISHSVLLRMRNVSDKSLWRKSKHTIYVQKLFPENRAVYEIM